MSIFFYYFYLNGFFLHKTKVSEPSKDTYRLKQMSILSHDSYTLSNMCFVYHKGPGSDIIRPPTVNESKIFPQKESVRKPPISYLTDWMFYPH